MLPLARNHAAKLPIKLHRYRRRRRRRHRHPPPNRQRRCPPIE